MSFKKDFVWGCATSAYQIEGGYKEDGKGLDVWDVFSHTPGKVYSNQNGDTACDHYHRYKEDVKLMKEIGLKAYRFSINWTRIFPEGTGKVKEKGVEFYSNLIDELLKNGIEPYITLFHWEYPYELYKKGGWLNDECVNWFADYAGEVVKRFSDRVKNFITFNEPQIFIGEGHVKGPHAPGLKVSPTDMFKMCHNTLKAHGAAVIAMRKQAKQPIRIGYAPAGSPSCPVTNDARDIEAARKAQFECDADFENAMLGISWWSDPVVLGKYPEDGLKKYKDYLPEITEEDMKLINQPLDFYAQNIYSNKKEVRADADGEPVDVKRKDGLGRTTIGWPVTPESLYWGPKFLYERYKLPVVITENGMAAHDWVSIDGKVHDPNRIDFLERYLKELERAVDDGVDVQGYFLWSFLDNFEWALGYSERFGIVYVDFETQERTIKDSGRWYAEWIKKHS